MKEILVVDLHVDAKFKRNFRKLISRINEVGGHASEADFQTLPKMDTQTLNTSYSGMVLGGTEALFTRTADRAKFSDLLGFIPKITLPTLGICGGHQVLALAYGGSVAKMGRLVQGFRTIALEDKDTLLAGLPSKIRVMEDHWEEVKRLPPGFIRTAKSDEAHNEGMKHEEKAVYGVQFHPERWNEENQAGKQILENFILKISR